MAQQMSDPFLLRSSAKSPKGRETEDPPPTKPKQTRTGRRDRTFRDLKILGVDEV